MFEFLSELFPVANGANLEAGLTTEPKALVDAALELLRAALVARWAVANLVAEFTAAVVRAPPEARLLAGFTALAAGVRTFLVWALHPALLGARVAAASVSETDTVDGDQVAAETLQLHLELARSVHTGDMTVVTTTLAGVTTCENCITSLVALDILHICRARHFALMSTRALPLHGDLAILCTLL